MKDGECVSRLAWMSSAADRTSISYRLRTIVAAWLLMTQSHRQRRMTTTTVAGLVVPTTSLSTPAAAAYTIHQLSVAPFYDTEVYSTH